MGNAHWDFMSEQVLSRFTCLECQARPSQIPNACWTTFALMEQK